MLDEKSLSYVFGREEASQEKPAQKSVLEQLIGPALDSVDTSVSENGTPFTEIRFKGTLKELANAIQDVLLGSLERQKNDLEAQFSGQLSDKDREIESLKGENGSEQVEATLIE